MLPSAIITLAFLLPLQGVTLAAALGPGQLPASAPGPAGVSALMGSSAKTACSSSSALPVFADFLPAWVGLADFLAVSADWTGPTCSTASVAAAC